MMKHLALITAASLALASPLAFAATTHKQAQTQPASSAHKSVQVWNWSSIDTNKDHLISPDEMQKFLTAQWKAAKTASNT
jgi:hypothetical protein